MNAYYLGLVLHNRIMVWFGYKKIFHSFHFTVASQQEGRRFSCDTRVCVYRYLPHTDFLCGNLDFGQMELTPKIIAIKAAMGRENKALIGNDGVDDAAAAAAIRN